MSSNYALRLKAAEDAITAHRAVIGEDLETSVRDLIADLLTYAESEPETFGDPEAEHAWGWRHYVAEKYERTEVAAVAEP